MQITPLKVWIASVGLTLLCAALCRVYLECCRVKDHKKAFWYKGAAGLCFVLLGLMGTSGSVKCALSPGAYCSSVSADFARMIAAGLGLGLMGDQLLALRFIYGKYETQFFAAGTLSFAFGHILYICALSMRAPGILVTGLAIGLAALAVSVVFNCRKDTNAGKMQAPGMLYMAIVAFMGALAVSVAIHAPGVSTLLFAVGGVLFIISDNILCAYSFGSERRFGANIGIHATYYAAQLLIAWSVFFM